VNLVKDYPDLIGCIRLQARGSPPAAVVIDTLNRSLAGSESDDKDMAAYIRAADAIRDAFGCAVIVVHHCGVDATRPRGHTSLTGAVDAQLAVKRDLGDNIVVTVEWMKDGPEGDIIASRLEAVEVGQDVDGDAITSCIVVPTDNIEQPKRIKLAPMPRAGLEQLHECIADLGQVRPGTTHLPAGVQSVTLEQWKERLDVTGIINRDGSHREQFRRIRVTLQNARLIGIWDDLVWSVTSRHIGVT
jgi:AAA domain